MAVLSARGNVDSLDSTRERRRHHSLVGLVLLLRSKIMRFQKAVPMLLSVSITAVSPMTPFPASALAKVVCSGHKLLPTPRPESSCSNVKPTIYASPDGALRALVLAVDFPGRASAHRSNWAGSTWCGQNRDRPRSNGLGATAESTRYQ